MQSERLGEFDGHGLASLAVACASAPQELQLPPRAMKLLQSLAGTVAVQAERLRPIELVRVARAFAVLKSARRSFTTELMR